MPGSNSLRQIVGEIRDLTSAFDRLTSTMSEGDLVKKINAPGATGQLKVLRDALDDVYNTHSRILDQLNRAIKINRERQNQIKDEIRQLQKLAGKKGLTQQQAQELKELIKLRDQKLIPQEEELMKKRVEEIKTRKFSSELDKQQPLRTRAIIAAKTALGASYVYLTGAIRLYTRGLEYLERMHKRTWEWQERLQKNLSQLAFRFGAATDAVVAMRDEGLKQLLSPDGLGGLGLELEDIVGRLGDFNEQFGFTRRVSQATAADLLKLGIAVGMSAGEVGELARVFHVAGQSVKDTDKFMRMVAVEASRAGVNSARLAKQFTGAAKALFMLSGPKARQALVKTAANLEKMGVGLDKLQGFVEMTDTFDQTAEAMARLNTAFGTHLNALDIFAEQDPEKRFEMMRQQIGLQVHDLDQLSRAEKRYMAQAMGVEADVLDAMIARSKMTPDQLKAEKELGDLKAKELAAQKAIEKSMIRSRQVLVAQQAITANINDALTRQMAPFYDAFAEGGGLEKGSKMFDSYTKKWVQTVGKIEKALGEQGASAALASIGKTFGKIWDTIMDLISGPAVASFLTGVVGAFGIVSDLLLGIVTVVSPFVKVLAWLIGKALQLLDTGWKFLKLIPGVAGAALGAASGGGSMSEAAADFVTNSTEGKSFVAAAMGVSGQADKAAIQPSGAMVDSKRPEARALGGPVEQGQYYVTSERGPELFLAPSDGTILPAAQTSAALGKARSAGGAGAGGQSGQAQPIVVQVILDGEVIQERMYKANLRSHQ